MHRLAFGALISVSSQAGATGVIWGGSPYIKGSVDTPAFAYAVAVAGGYAYVADGDPLDGSNNGLRVVDISNPSAPAVVGSVVWPGSAVGVAVAGGHAYVAGRSAGLQVIDISNPSAPAVVGSVDTPDVAIWVAVAGGHAYVADRFAGLQVIDISNPTAPAVVGSVATVDSARGVAVAGGHAYVADNAGGLQVIDISDPSAPAVVGSVVTPGFARAESVAVAGGYAYVVSRGDGLQVIDISNPSAPVVVGSVATPVSPEGVAVAGRYAYVADDGAGLQVIDISDPSAPAVVYSVVTPGSAVGVAVAGGHVYVAARTGGLQVIDISMLPSFAWPVLTASMVPVITQDYTCRGSSPSFPGGTANCYSPDRHHAGIDFEAATGSGVLATAGGVITKVCVDGDPGNDSQNPASDCFTGGSRPDQLGTVITVRHANGLYSLYAHLSAVESGIEPGVTVEPGQKLGEAGDSGNVTGPHLHFELKHSDELINLAAANIYPSQHPNVYGYFDPWPWFENAGISPTAIEVVWPEGLYVRRGPGTQYAVMTEVLPGQRYTAFARIDDEGDTWYRIHLPCRDNNSCAGWVAGINEGEVYSTEVEGQTQVEVGDTEGVGLKVRNIPSNPTAVDKVYDRQRFVRTATAEAPPGNGCSSSWYEIYQPYLIAGSTTGWVCGDYVTIVGDNAGTGLSSFQGRVLADGGAPLAGVAIGVTGPSPQLLTSAGDGTYSFSNALAGAYTISPVLAGYEFSPASISRTAAGANYTGLDFRACATGQDLILTLEDLNGRALTASDVTIEVDGNPVSFTSDGNGNFTASGLACGEHEIAVQPANGANFETAYLSIDTFSGWSDSIQVTQETSSLGLDDNSGFVGDPVDTATGNYIYQRRDLEIPGIGMPFVFERSYSSRDDAAGIGPLGEGNWTHNWNTSLTVDGITGDVTIRWGDGGTQTWAPDGSGGFIPQSGVFDDLIDDGGGAFTLQKRSLTEYQFNASGQLTAVVDKNGNSISLAYTTGNLTSITDTAGRLITISYDASNRIETITDPIGRTIQFAYDANNDLVSATDGRGNTTAYAYDAQHQITSITDPKSNVIVSNTYSADKRVVTFQTDAKGGQTTYVYNFEHPLGRETVVTDALGSTTKHYHDNALRLIREEDANQSISLFQYDAAGNRTSVTDKNGNVTSYVYDANGNVTNKTDALGNTTTITYDSLNNPLTRTDALANVTTFTYDGVGNLLTTTDAESNTTTVTYYPNGLPHTVTDARNHTTTNTYDTEGNLTEVEDPLTHTTTHTYDGVGRRTSTTDALGRTTQYTYDNNDNLLTVTDALLEVITHTYDENDNRLTTVDRNGNLTTFTYDQKDLLETTTDALGGTTTNSYDGLDRRLTLTDRNGGITAFSYDGVGNQLTVTDALLNVRNATFDANNNRLTSTDPLGKTTFWTYDALDRPATVTDPLGNTTTTIYDALGRTTSVENAKGQVTGFVYDDVGRLTEVHDAEGGVVLYTYDQVGNRTSMTDPNGNVTTYTYDELNRLKTKIEPAPNNHTTTYYYDAVGNVTQITKPNTTVIQYAYDALDRLETITYPDLSTVTFTYDDNGNRTGMTDSLGTHVSVYDALDRLTTQTDPFGNIVGYAYDALGNRTSLTYPGNKTVTYAYDALNRLTDVTDWLNNTTQYSYDTAGRMTGVTNANGTTATYAYDDADRLINLTNRLADNSVISSYDYTLDSLGNPITEQRDEPIPPLLVPGTTNYTHDTENRLTTIDGVPNAFDANGNQLGRGVEVTQVFDYEDRLAQRIENGVTTDYFYDGLGDRRERLRDGITTRYILDTNTSLTNALAEADGVNAITAYNIYGLGLISRIGSSNDEHYYHYDPRGSTIVLTDEDGQVTDRYSYDPFGRALFFSGDTDNPYTYIGRHGVIDEGDNLSFIRARYYDREQQRFISKDSYEGADRISQSLHLYAYGLNNPISLIDISGYSPQDVASQSLIRDAETPALKSVSKEYSVSSSDKAADHGHESISVLGITICDAEWGLVGYLGCIEDIDRITYEVEVEVLEATYYSLVAVGSLATGGINSLGFLGSGTQLLGSATKQFNESIGENIIFAGTAVNIVGAFRDFGKAVKAARYIGPAVSQTGINVGNVLKSTGGVAKIYGDLLGPALEEVVSPVGGFLYNQGLFNNNCEGWCFND